MKIFDDPTLDAPWTRDLPRERVRLVRLCARLTGSAQAAEDLAQETLFEAWRNADKLRDAACWQAFVSGIARNVCLRWRRTQGQESRVDTLDPFLERGIADAFDLEAAVEQHELAHLLDKALDVLPGDARALLVERYVEGLPQSESAARRGLTENAVGVRIHRAKDAFRRALSAPAARADAAAYGLIATGDENDWQETRLWCPRCGSQHLQGKFTRDKGEATLFAVRCPVCADNLGIDFSSVHPAIDTPTLFGDVRGFKPALARLSGWWHQYHAGGTVSRVLACSSCGKYAAIVPAAPRRLPARLAAIPGLFIHCAHCDKAGVWSASGIAFHSPDGQRFWREQGRMRLLPERDVVMDGEAAIVVSLKSLTRAAQIEIILSRTDFRTLRVFQTG